MVSEDQFEDVFIWNAIRRRYGSSTTYVREKLKYGKRLQDLFTYLSEKNFFFGATLVCFESSFLIRKNNNFKLANIYFITIRY